MATPSSKIEIKLMTANLSIKDPALTLLTTKTYTDKFTPVPNTRLPKSIKVVLDAIYQALTGEPLPVEDTSLAVSCGESGTFYRLYPPKLFAKPELEDPETFYPCIRWGNSFIRLAFDEDNNLVPTVKLPKGDKLAFKFTKFNPSDRGEDPALEIKLSSAGCVYSVAIAMGVMDWKGYSPDLFDATLGSSPEAFLDLLHKEKEYTEDKSVGYNQLETTSVRFIKSQAYPDGLTQELRFNVIGQRKVTTRVGETFVLTCSPTDIEQIALVLPFTANPDGFGMWADGAIVGALFQGANRITPETPATVVVPIKGKVVIILPDSGNKVEGDLDLDF